MRKQIKVVTLLLLGALVWTGCEVEDPELAPAPTSEQVAFSVQPTASNPNILSFTSTSPGFKALWDFGDGATGDGTTVTHAYPLKGEYTVKLTIYTAGGSTSSTKKVTIANTNPTMLNREDYNFLTGGANQLEGKTWVIDKEASGHLGIGPITGTTPEWYTAAPNEKASEGYYDDEMIFKLGNTLSYTYKNNGTTFANGDNAAGIGGTNGGGDKTVNYTPPTNLTWSILDENGKKYLILSNGGFIGYYTGVSRYEILKLTADEMYIRSGSAAVAEHAWYQKLVRKGYSVPKPPKEYKAVDINDNFDTPGNFTWKFENILFNDSYDNPAQVAANNSEKVARYTRQAGQANEFGNAFIQFKHNLDLTQRHVFKVKVFLPSYNDYTTQGGAEDWSAVKTLQRQLSVKLQNSELGGNAWTTQAEIVQQVTQMDQWVELTFDFSAHASRKDFDKIIVQFGGEAHWNPGIFYLDDFRLMP
ncbi:PKD domain-containing protein [Rufibacter soli]